MADSYKEKVLSRLILKISNYVEWENKKDNQVNLCSYGLDNISYHLDKEIGINLNNVTIIQNAKIDKLSECNILYIPKNKESDLALVLDKIKDKSILTISNIENFVSKGGMFEIYFTRNNNIEIYANSQYIKNNNIKIKYQLRNIINY